MLERLALAATLLTALQAPARALSDSEETRQYTLTHAGAGSPGSAVGSAGLSDTGFVTGSLSARGRSAPLGYRWSSAEHGSGPALVPDRETWGGSSAVDVN